jgi:hypothetical protein
MRRDERRPVGACAVMSVGRLCVRHRGEPAQVAACVVVLNAHRLVTEEVSNNLD